MREIRLAKTAGFCFGVSKAVDRVYELLHQGREVRTLGPIIHNPQLVARLEEQGVCAVETPEEVPPGAVLVIRSHGVPPAILRRFQERGVEICDATCPFVAKIHRIVERESSRGATVLIAGDEGHPEVVGIRGYCHTASYAFSTLEELKNLLYGGLISVENPVIMVSQTTFNRLTWEKCVKFAKTLYTNLLVFDTICNATVERQSEAVALSQVCDGMVIVGGRQSSNTAKLKDVWRGQLSDGSGRNGGRAVPGDVRRDGDGWSDCRSIDSRRNYKGGTFNHVGNCQQQRSYRA